MSQPSKKPKLACSGQTQVQTAIDKLAALDLNFLPAPPALASDLNALASDLIAPLKPGIGLLGNPEEEKEFYAQYEEDLQRDEDQQHPDQRTGDTDLDDVQPKNATENGEDDEQQGQIQPIHRDEDEDTADEDDLAEGVALSEQDRLVFGRDFITVDGERIHATEFFGPKWTQRIRDLYAVPPMEHPDKMTIVLHEHQLKGAAQMHFLCNSPFRGGILADGMGVGKTHTAIASMFLVKDEPGFSMVVAPKTLCLQWVNAIECAWQEGYGVRAYLLEGSSMTAHELLALGVDVVVCSYEQVQAYGRAREALPDELDAYNNDQTGTIKKPTRPNAVLHSSFWQELKLPIKRLILDEAQVVNKRRSGNQGVRHGAIKDLFYHSVILLSGTPAHNKWDNFSGLVDFLQGHPFETHHKFMRTFASLDHEGKIDRPDLPRMRLLQRFIQAFTIARPSDILKLKDCIRCRASFHIRKYGRTTIDDLVHRYLKLMAMQNGDRASFEVESSAKEALACAVRAQLMSLSPFLLEESEQPNIDDFVDIDEDDPIYGYVSGDRAAKGEEDRGEWLKKVRGRDQLITESDRVRQFLLVYKQLRRTYPNRKILVFSQYLKFLDILEEALKRAFGISVLRFDGTVGQRQRLHVQQRFKDSDPEVPLLMTAGSGAYGLNITDASIIIQCEIWWNSSVEWQAICRVWRQNQTSEVLAIQLYSQDSAIDQEISKVQVKKADITSELMGPVIRRPGEEPDIRDLCFPIVVEL